MKVRIKVKTHDSCTLLEGDGGGGVFMKVRIKVQTHDSCTLLEGDGGGGGCS